MDEKTKKALARENARRSKKKQSKTDSLSNKVNEKPQTSAFYPPHNPQNET